MLMCNQTALHENNFSFKESNYLEIPKWEFPNFSQKEIECMNGISVKEVERDVLTEYKICIPKSYSRGESDKYVPVKDCEDVPHYELYIERQIGSVRNRRDTYLYLRLPESGMLVTIILYMDGGVGFDPKFHKYILRELDELDRRVILGFCLQNEGSLRWACYSNENEYKRSLELKASKYNISQMPKRLKTGSRDNDFTSMYNDLEPYEESNIFSNMKLI